MTGRGKEPDASAATRKSNFVLVSIRGWSWSIAEVRISTLRYVPPPTGLLFPQSRNHDFLIKRKASSETFSSGNCGRRVTCCIWGRIASDLIDIWEGSSWASVWVPKITGSQSGTSGRDSSPARAPLVSKTYRERSKRRGLLRGASVSNLGSVWHIQSPSNPMVRLPNGRRSIPFFG